MQHIDGFCFLIHSFSVCLLIEGLNPRIFKVIIEMFTLLGILTLWSFSIACAVVALGVLIFMVSCFFTRSVRYAHSSLLYFLQVGFIGYKYFRLFFVIESFSFSFIYDIIFLVILVQAGLYSRIGLGIHCFRIIWLSKFSLRNQLLFWLVVLYM